MPKNEELGAMLKDLESQGCFPSIYKRGRMWRAHVNRAGNFWDESPDPVFALAAATRAWKRAGKPMDGAADKGASKLGIIKVVDELPQDLYPVKLVTMDTCDEEDRWTGFLAVGHKERGLDRSPGRRFRYLKGQVLGLTGFDLLLRTYLECPSSSSSVLHILSRT